MPGDTVLDGVPCGQEEHAHVGAYAVQRAQHGEAVGVRQHDVQDDGVGQQLARLGDSRDAVRRRADLPALVAQGAGEYLGEVGFVVDDEDPDRGAVGPGQRGAAGAAGAGSVHLGYQDASRRVPGRFPTSEFPLSRLCRTAPATRAFHLRSAARRAPLRAGSEVASAQCRPGRPKGRTDSRRDTRMTTAYAHGRSPPRRPAPRRSPAGAGARRPVGGRRRRARPVVARHGLGRGSGGLAHRRRADRGLLAGYACAVLVGLMARIPLLERRIGHRPAGALARHGRAATRSVWWSRTPC